MSDPAPPRLRLLLVDDDVVDRLSVRRALEAAGIDAEIEEAESAATAIARLRAGPYDCALLDYNLPGGDGLQVLRQVREAEVDTPVVVLTGHGDERVAVELMKAGASDYFSKNALSAEKLAQSLRNAIRVHQAELQARESAAALRRYVGQLRALAAAAVAINSTQELDALLSSTTEKAREIIGAHQAMTTLALGRDASAIRTCVSLSERYAEFGSLIPDADPLGLGRFVCESNRPLRLTHEQLQAQPGWQPPEETAEDQPPPRGWLAAPLVSRSGENIGAIHLSDRYEGEFTTEDEAVLVQLARLASVAVENLRLYEAAQQAARAREQVLAMVSHDLRNPLNTVVMGSTLLLETPLPPDQVPRQLAAIRRSAETMNRMIQDLLDVTRMEAGRLAIAASPMAVEPLVLEAVELLGPLARERSLELIRDVQRDLPTIEADRDRLLQVFSNLIGNAVKFTEPGGRITVRARRSGTGVRLSVEDTGRGIDGDDLQRVFEPFWQVEKATRLGAGLGLPIARGIVEAHGGRIWAESTPGAGSTFHFELPAAQLPVEEAIDATG